jgi:hypothetical protein
MSILDHPPNEDLLERREDVNLDVELIAGKPHERIIPLSLSAIGLAVLAACGGGTNEGTSTVTIPENSAPASSIPSTPNSTANSTPTGTSSGTPSGAPTQPTDPTGSSGTPTTSN